jgi:hypothetical protein
VYALLKERETELHRVCRFYCLISTWLSFHVLIGTEQLADALVEYETLDLGDVKRAVRGDEVRAKPLASL